MVPIEYPDFPDSIHIYMSMLLKKVGVDFQDDTKEF